MTTASVSLDTSVVMRLLVALPAPQFVAATRHLAGVREAGGTAYVSDLALAEAYFALQTFYELDKAAALAALAEFIKMPGITPTSHASDVLAMPNLASAKPGFVDRLIHGASLSEGHPLVTFEKTCRHLPGMIVLSHVDL